MHPDIGDSTVPDRSLKKTHTIDIPLDGFAVCLCYLHFELPFPITLKIVLIVFMEFLAAITDLYNSA